MSFSENRFPLFRDMRWLDAAVGKSAAAPELPFRWFALPADGNGDQYREFAIGELGLTFCGR